MYLEISRKGGVSMEDKLLQCQDCKNDFKFRATDQAFYKKNNFQDPKRCPGCRKRRKQIKERQEKEFNE